MKKRLLSCLLAAVLAAGLLPAALASAPAETEAAQVLAAMDIMVGDETGALQLDRAVTRAEFTKMAVAASTSRDSVGDTTSVKPYPDVPHTHWAAPYIKTAVDLGLVQGDLRGRFNPDRTITLAEGVTIVLRLLEYQDSDFTGVWPSGQMSQYRALELNEGITIGQNDNMTRRDAMYLFYNLLVTKNKSGQYHLNVLEPSRNLVNQNGEIDRVALINSAMEGPVLAGSDWRTRLPFAAGTATVYRDGKKSQAASILPQDVLYWSESMRTVWAYTRQVTGQLTKISPSKSAPTSVTVAGSEYELSTTGAAYDVSDLGERRVGDYVTLLLDREEKAAAVLSAEENSRILCGVVVSVGDATYDDGEGGTYEASTATVRLTDGNTYSYQTGKLTLEGGDLVQVVTRSGAVELKRLSGTSITGTFSSDGTRLGSYKLAEDVEILDAAEKGASLRVYPGRLAGVTLGSGMVRYYVLDTQGDISHLILNDVTGDMHKYGVVTDITKVDTQISGVGFVMASQYTYDVGGQTGVCAAQDKIYNVEEGPAQIKMADDYTVDRPCNLTERKLQSVSGNLAMDTNNRSHTMSDAVAVYELVDGEYKYSSINRVNDGEHTLTGWYDKAESSGGRIRVIVAK